MLCLGGLGGGCGGLGEGGLWRGLLPLNSSIHGRKPRVTMHIRKEGWGEAQVSPDLSGSTLVWGWERRTGGVEGLSTLRED